MSRHPYQHLYEDGEIFAVDLVRRAADPTATTDTEHALRDLAHRHPALTEYDAAIALTGALARLSCTTLRAAYMRHHPLAARLLDDQPAPSTAQAREITEVLDRMDADLLSADRTPLGHCFIELIRLALAELLPGGRPLHESAAAPLDCALSSVPGPADALLPLVVRAAQLTLACLHHLLDLDSDTTHATGRDSVVEQVLDGFELYKITQQAAGAGAS
ncbi:hypothetical protein [Kitasatospora herbaricolor]|uniref:TetR family transcriptional regulator n=1 Tax=Kitasatospora herbaricolor TaxID=68217 RepID=A0ABZ1W0I5_9ACTN|nr:hypothetical protein [Kitasatospora herbaricolor]